MEILVPEHVAIIMDGNGRWANARSHARVWGHIRGSRIVSEIVEEADEQGVKALTLYAFSAENWCRPKFEISILFKLLKKFLLKEKERLLKNNVCFKVIGDTANLPKETLDLISDLENVTKDATGLKLTFAFGYGGREEIISSFNQFIKNNPGKEITKNSLEKLLLTHDLGDVDLLIRTGGDQRVSNFLLWQIAYAELYFTETKWPSFKRDEFRKIIRQFSGRERRFGSIKSEESLKKTESLAKNNKENFSREGQS